MVFLHSFSFIAFNGCSLFVFPWAPLWPTAIGEPPIVAAPPGGTHWTVGKGARCRMPTIHRYGALIGQHKKNKNIFTKVHSFPDHPLSLYPSLLCLCCCSLVSPSCLCFKLHNNKQQPQTDPATTCHCPRRTGALQASVNVAPNNYHACAGICEKRGKRKHGGILFTVDRGLNRMSVPKLGRYIDTQQYFFLALSYCRMCMQEQSRPRNPLPFHGIFCPLLFFPSLSFSFSGGTPKEPLGRHQSDAQILWLRRGSSQLDRERDASPAFSVLKVERTIVGPP